MRMKPYCGTRKSLINGTKDNFYLGENKETNKIMDKIAAIATAALLWAEDLIDFLVRNSDD